MTEAKAPNILKTAESFPVAINGVLNRLVEGKNEVTERGQRLLNFIAKTEGVPLRIQQAVGKTLEILSAAAPAPNKKQEFSLKNKILPLRRPSSRPGNPAAKPPTLTQG